MVLNQDEVFVGFTSSTGSGWGNHDIRNFYFDNDNTVIDTDIDIYEAAPTQVTASASPALTNDSSLVTVEVKNHDNSPAAGKLVSFSTTIGTIQPTATTDLNGIAQAAVSSSVSGTAAIKAVAVGGAYAETSVTFDTDAPTTTVLEIIPLVPDGANGWYISDPAVKFTAVDNLSGVAQTEYRLNGGHWTTYTDGIVLGEGQHVIDYRSSDNLGNMETVKSISFKSDHTAPATTIAINQAEPKGSGEWYDADAVVSFDASDALSGVNRTEYRLNQGDWVSYSGPFTLTEGVYRVEYRSVDLAGNTEPVREETIQVDHTAPAFTISANPSQLWPANHKMIPVTVTLNAKDSGSQVAQIILESISSSEPANGAGDGNTSADIAGAQYGTGDTSFELRAERSGNGTGRIYTITYLITDHAGNRTTASVTVTVPHDAAKK
ncbi:hypothetical protein E5161_09820 [Cohnella pontilimi]|uniref:Big-1 domain-containing protein n=1 Tax=Cohnella pontilimi TaxID=2564100 RepID=A0A4U0FC42_9BACL|nr:Ig-like domain-containing protein [Cohnella pontilimi]TJY42287.1 hypothetical protein E5161_09820 [Cohnella pontilimi]